MIYAYNVSLPGAYHVKNKIPNQDYCEVKKCNDVLAFAAVADGLGSAEHSDVASKIAVEESISHCIENITLSMHSEELLSVVKKSFLRALNEIEKKAKLENHDITSYDTTLSFAVLMKDRLFYGHSGDSGIVALTTKGQYKKVTEQQRDENGCVFPLFFKEKWIFGEFDEKVCSLFLATDGMLETLFPFYIRNEEVSIYVTLAEFFMDNRRLQIEKRGELAVKEEIEKFIFNIPEEQVNDDKTVVVLINTSIKPKLMHADYYKEPDWVALKQKHDEEWKRQAYPHLYVDSDIEKKEDSIATETKYTSNQENNSCETKRESLSSIAEKSKSLLENVRTKGIDLVNKGIDGAEKVIDIISGDEDK